MLLTKWNVTEKVESYWQSGMLLTKWNVTDKVESYWQSGMLLTMLNVTDNVECYWQSGMLLKKWHRHTQTKTCSVSLYSLQTPHVLAWKWTRVFAVKSAVVMYWRGKLVLKVFLSIERQMMLIGIRFIRFKYRSEHDVHASSIEMFLFYFAKALRLSNDVCVSALDRNNQWLFCQS